MKKQSQNKFSQISNEVTEKLTFIAKETIAIGFTQTKIFSTADLWNIQRKSKTILHRRNYV